MARLVLCDTNVWLDYYIGARPGHRAARDLLISGSGGGIAFMVPASCHWG